MNGVIRQEKELRQMNSQTIGCNSIWRPSGHGTLTQLSVNDPHYRRGCVIISIRFIDSIIGHLITCNEIPAVIKGEDWQSERGTDD